MSTTSHSIRLDGSAEPANEILEQTSHDRPLVAQTYSAAVAKGKKGEGKNNFIFSDVAQGLCLMILWHALAQVTLRIREQ